jgi:serine/threonine-protein kinase
MAEVFLAEEQAPVPDTGQLLCPPRRVRGRELPGQLVIKRMLPALAAEEQYRKMFSDEAGLQARFDHPNIVRLLEAGEVGGVQYMALEYVDGPDTLDLVRQLTQRTEALSPALACYICEEVCAALDYAHGLRREGGAPLGVIHRDISPSNVFLSRRGEVKLGDFGIAHVDSEARSAPTLGGTLKGKYGYMSPEQVMGGTVDARADLFAVGILLAELMMGRRLFIAPTDLDILLMVRDVKLDRLDRHGGAIPAALKQVIRRLLDRDPTQRPATGLQARALIHAALGAEHGGRDELRRLLDRVIDPTDEPLWSDGGEGAEAGSDGSGESLALLGAETRARQLVELAEAAAVRKAAEDLPRLPPPPPRILSERSAPPSEVEDSVGDLLFELDTPALLDLDLEDIPWSEARHPDTGTFIEPPSRVVLPTGPAAVGASSSQEARPDLSGQLAHLSAIRLFTGLAVQKATGLLVIERASIAKEIYLVDGAPEFVSSNVASERLGEFLVAEGVLSEESLQTALRLLPRFRYKLGDTLIALELMRPLELFRLLSRQVRAKLLDIFQWEQGTFRFFRGRRNEVEQFPLRLDALEIVGAAAAELPLELVRLRLALEATRRVRRVERAQLTPEDFRVGTAPRQLWQRLDGVRTVGDWMRRYSDEVQRARLYRTLDLLIESELAVLE